MLEKLRQRWRDGDDQPRVNPILLAELRLLAMQENKDEARLLNELLAAGIEARRALQRCEAQWQTLTVREQEIAALVCLNFTNPQIAEHLVISVNTVKTHLKRLLGKFGLHSKDELRLLLKDWDFSDWFSPHE